jgi:hypothetical protein
VNSLEDSEKMLKEFKSLQNEVWSKNKEWQDKAVSNLRTFSEHKRRMDEMEKANKDMLDKIKELEERPIASA